MSNKGMENTGFEWSEMQDRPPPNQDPGTIPIPPPPQPSTTATDLDERPEREQWTNKREFMLSCVSMAVGVGNVWRFPFVALENGGGAFLIPYIIVLIFLGKPLYYLEFCIGQFGSFGSVEVWELSPAFRGVGLGQMFCTWAVVTFYVILMALCVFYFFASFSSVLPWSLCGPWAGPSCMDANSTFLNGTNSTADKISAAEEYFMKEVLHLDPEGFHNGIGAPEWRLTLCLVFSWIVIFIIQAQGVKSSGKAAYFTALFPYLVLFIMLIRGVTLPGSTTGLLYFITPHWEKLLDPNVWYAAVDQAFFSLSIGFGNVIMLASYNKFHNNVYLDASIIALIDTLTCLLAGFTTFAILGHLADLLGVEVDEVIKGGGTSLAFISYPDALARFTFAPQIFSVLFFLMMFTLGLGSAVPYNGVIITAISDQFPGISKMWITLGVCLSGFTVGLLYTTPQGQIILTLVNHYAGGVSIIALMILELVGVVWVYGLARLIQDIKFMLGRDTGWYWKVCWGIFNPIFLMVVFIYSQVIATPLTYGTYVFDNVTTGVGVGLAVVAVLMVPIMFLVELKKIYATSPSLLQALKDVFKPSSKWGPKDITLRQEYRQILASKEYNLASVWKCKD